MQRIFSQLCLCALLIGGISTLADAGPILATVDLTARALPVTLSVRNAQVTDILSALFAATNDRYSLRLGLGIRGSIDHLQLDAQSFDQALHAILAQANADYTFAKQGDGVYRVFNTNAPPLVIPVITMPRAGVIADMMVMKITLPILDKKDLITNHTDTPSVPAMTIPGTSAPH